MMYDTQLNGRMFYQSEEVGGPPQTHMQSHTRTVTDNSGHLSPTYTDSHSQFNRQIHTPKSSRSNPRHISHDTMNGSRTPPLDNAMDMSPQRQYVASAEHQVSMQQYGNSHPRMGVHSNGMGSSVEDIPIDLADSRADYKYVSEDTKHDTKVRILREFYVGMLGVQTVFMFVNFAFANISGALLTMLGLFSGGYAHLDRRVSTFSLNAILQFVIMLVVAISVGTTVPGFDLYKQDSTLQAISIAHVPLSFIFAILSSYFARLEYLNAYKNKKLEANQTEMPKVMISENATHPMSIKDNEHMDADMHNMHANLYANV